MAVRDLKLRSRLSKDIHLSRDFRHFRSLSIRKSACVNAFLARFRKSVRYKGKVGSRCLHYLPAAILEDQGGPQTWRFHSKL